MQVNEMGEFADSASALARTAGATRATLARRALERAIEDLLWQCPVEISREAAFLIVARGVEAGARSMGLSAKTVARRFKATGCSMTEFVADVRIRAALDLLGRRWRADSIAGALGFASHSSLGRFLRRRTGTPVRRLRRKLELVRCP